MNIKRLCMTRLWMVAAAMPFAANFFTVQASENETGAAAVENNGIIQQPAGKMDEPTARLFNRIDERLASLQRYEDAKTNASAEDLQVLQLQIYKVRMGIIDDIHLLADELLKLEKDGPQPELREQVENAFNRITPLLWNHIERMQKEIDAIRASRAETTPEKRAVIEYNLAALTGRLDAFFRTSYTHISKMEQMGLTTQAATQTFVGLLEARADELSGRIDLALVRIEELSKQGKDTPDDTTIAARLAAVKKSLDTNIASLETTVGLMEPLGLDTKDLRALLVTAPVISAPVSWTPVWLSACSIAP
jgi:hypothetical protein